jgi:uncharacterized membrane protein YbhN (UPF0104 family)
MPIFISMICVLCSCYALYLCSVASGQSVPLLAALATFPVIAVAGLLPLGFAGLGGYQLIAVAVFGILGVPSNAVSSASVLQNAMQLVVNTTLGIAHLHHSGALVKKILQQRGKR